MDGLSLTVVRSIKDVANSLAAPFFGAAYFLQSGGPKWHFTASFDDARRGSHIPIPIILLPHHSLASVPFPSFLVIFLAKVLIGGAVFTFCTAVFAKIAYDAQHRPDSTMSEWIVLIPWSIKTACLAFALLGFLFRWQYPELRHVNIFWYAACAIWGLSISTDIPRGDPPSQKLPPSAP